jgi:hypothetical protein
MRSAVDSIVDIVGVRRLSASKPRVLAAPVVRCGW